MYHSKVKISSSITVPYSFIDEKTGKEIKGENIYVMVSYGGIPRIEKASAPIISGVEVEYNELVFDYKKRIITVGF